MDGLFQLRMTAKIPFIIVFIITFTINIEIVIIVIFFKYNIDIINFFFSKKFIIIN
jgi:hypothetical protein